MSRKCFFIDDDLSRSRGEVILTGDAAHHLRVVMRSQVGEAVELRDGRGGVRRGIVESLEKGSARVRLEERTPEKPGSFESPLVLTLALAYARSDRMDQVVRQATELGVHRLAAFRAGRSQYGLSEARKRKRRGRWEKIGREALCQCRRTFLPEVAVLSDLDEFLEKLPVWEGGRESRLRILAWEGDAEGSLWDMWRGAPACESAVLLVGPEGGWAAGEARRLQEAGFQAVTLGPRILRFETAAVSLCAAAQLLWGDLGRPHAS